MNDATAIQGSRARDMIGIGYILLSGIGVACPPTTARLAYESGSDAYTVAFARGVPATLILAALVAGSIVMFERRARI